MASAARALRTDLEALLRARKLDGTLTTALPVPEPLDEHVVAQTGVAVLDERLNGGLPRGQMSEVVGARSSGRASLLCHDACRRDHAGRNCRARRYAGHVRCCFGSSLRDRPQTAAVDQGPGAGGRASVDSRQWAVGSPRWAGQGHAASCPSGVLWDRAVDRAVKALNLVLQAGTFGLVALDLAEVPLAVVRRLPFTTWLRLQRVIEGSDAACVLLGATPIARSAGGVTITLRRNTKAVDWRQIRYGSRCRVATAAVRACSWGSKSKRTSAAPAGPRRRHAGSEIGTATWPLAPAFASPSYVRLSLPSACSCFVRSEAS